MKKSDGKGDECGFWRAHPHQSANGGRDINNAMRHALREYLTRALFGDNIGGYVETQLIAAPEFVS